MSRFSVLSVLALVLLPWPAAVQAELRYRVEGLGLPDGLQGSLLYVTPMALNNRGEVTGFVDGAIEQTGFVYRNGHMQLLRDSRQRHVLLGDDINDRGQIVGQLLLDNEQRVPYVLDKGRFKDLGRPLDRDEWGEALGINEAGQVVGRLGQKGFIYDGTRSRYLQVPNPGTVWAQDINDAGVIVGEAFVNAPDGPNVWTFISEGSGFKLLEPPTEDGFSVLALDVNNAGQMLQLAMRNGTVRSFIYADGRYTPIPELGQEPSTRLLALNNQGWGVGDYSSLHGSALLYRDGVSYNLTSLIRPLDAANWILQSAADINERGQIVGYGIFRGEPGLQAFIATPVPEPGAWALMLGGLALMGAAARRRAADRSAPVAGA
ncbi:PEP-CTERM sorting domain-containing protein [Azohydromonas australica]|uniref:PEP-CTERM sorting domain-containing protein n=1 Tax=Azohydromonas australica TaxID=364039 RepID=UPI000404CD8C|nr:PEP-CTERM sorting domain-containing protein [Azohydromonas australica]